MSRINTTTIKEYAYSLGFDIARITSAEEFAETEQVIKERIAQGLMDGLPWFTKERASVSCHPNALLPEAQSIITLAMFYLTEQPDEREDGALRGRISRYAWGDDYHEIIKPKLQQFATWLRDYARNEIENVPCVGHGFDCQPVQAGDLVIVIGSSTIEQKPV